MGKIVLGEDHGLWEPAGLLLVFVGVLLDLFEDLAIGVGRGNVALDLGCFEYSLILKEVELLLTAFGVDVRYVFTLL